MPKSAGIFSRAVSQSLSRSASERLRGPAYKQVGHQLREKFKAFIGMCSLSVPIWQPNLATCKMSLSFNTNTSRFTCSMNVCVNKGLYPITNSTSALDKHIYWTVKCSTLDAFSFSKQLESLFAAACQQRAVDIQLLMCKNTDFHFFLLKIKRKFFFPKFSLMFFNFFL